MLGFVLSFLFFVPFGFRNASEGLGMAVCSYALGNLFITPSSLFVFVVGGGLFAFDKLGWEEGVVGIR